MRGVTGSSPVLPKLLLQNQLEWRNWQTRTIQSRVGQPVQVQLLSPALAF